MGLGLFIGLRVGIVTVLVVVYVFGFPMIGVFSLDLLVFLVWWIGCFVVVALDVCWGELFIVLF